MLCIIHTLLITLVAVRVASMPVNAPVTASMIDIDHAGNVFNSLPDPIGPDPLDLPIPTEDALEAYLARLKAKDLTESVRLKMNKIM